MPKDEAERFARLWHETYERLSPDYGWRSRRVAPLKWDELQTNTRRLMVATATEVLQKLDEGLV